MPADAIIPVTNLIDRLRASPATASLLGSPRSTYNIRHAMDEGKIVLACPGSGGEGISRLLSNFMIYDLLHAAKTRVDTDPEHRRPFHAFIDEVQQIDGAASGNLAAILEQTRKFGLRAYLLNQDPRALTDRTLGAVLNNRSHLMTSAVSAKSASLLTREWGDEPAPNTVQHLARYTYLAEVTIGSERTQPFLVHGVPVAEMWADCHHPERVPELDETIDATTGRRPTDETIAALDEHDQRIIEWLDRRRHERAASFHDSGTEPELERWEGPDEDDLPGSVSFETFEIPGDEEVNP